MRKHLLAAGVAVAALLPTIAFAQQTCEERKANQRTTATVIGGVAGALLGNAVSSHGGKTGGTIIGAVAGAAVGNQVGRSHEDCSNAYGYYDNNGRWHTNAVQTSNASGYYDRDGRWVEGAPSGYYDSNGRWVRADTSGDASGYRDSNGRWIPVSADGYYDTDGQWVAGAASGYYSESGQWVPGPARGHYDSNGRWINGEASGHRDANGNWISDPQPGYWGTDGRWRAGQTMGYYDGRGRWIQTSDTRVVVVSNTPVANPGYSDRYGQDRQGGYRSGREQRSAFWAEAGNDTRQREDWLGGRIRDAASRGSLDHMTAHRAMRTLSSIRRDDNSMRRRHGGDLSGRGKDMIQGRLDNLAASVRMQMQAQRGD